MSGSEGNGIDNELARLGFSDDVHMPTPPSAPPVDDFKDITKEFFEESEKLNVGELVKDPYFTLLQAVGALEIMDPKMDSGLLEPEYESFDALKLRPPEEVIGIMDRLLCHEMAWHVGHALSQTIYTCLYIDKLLSTSPKTLGQATFGKHVSDHTDNHQIIIKVLRPYCLALIRCCGYVNKQLMTEQLYEEEDFVTQTYGLPLLEHVSLDEMIALLEDARQWLESNEDSFSGEILNALYSRLSLRKNLLTDLSKDGSAYRGKVELLWGDTIKCIAEVEKTHVLGKPVDEAWSTSVQRKLASQIPPRPIVDIPFSKAISNLKQLCNEAQDLPKFLNYVSASNQVNYFLYFAARQPTPLPYSRSLIQGILFNKDFLLSLPFEQCVMTDGKSTAEVLSDDLQELCYPLEVLFDPANKVAEAPGSPGFEIATRMDWFLERAGKLFFDFHRNIVQNRSRWRRNLCHLILDWDSLQFESEEVDSELTDYTGEKALASPDSSAPPSFAFSLSSWVYHYKLRMMEWIVLLGFELEIYQTCESTGMYWYLQHYLRTRIGHLERIITFVQPSTEEGSSAKYMRTMSMLNYQLLSATAMQELATTLVHLFNVLSRQDLVRAPPPSRHSSDVLRYELRMKPFLHIGCPEVVEFEEFQRILESAEVPTEELLDMAKDSIGEAKKLYARMSKLDKTMARVVLCEADYRAETSMLLKSCFGIGVAIGVLVRELEAGTADPEHLEVTIEREGGYHPCFPVPIIKNKKR